MPSPSRRAKRLLDLTFALLGAAVALPLVPLLALAVKLESKGPVFVRERCVGEQRRRGEAGRRSGRRLHDVHGRLLSLWSFRVHAERRQAAGRQGPQRGRDGRLTGIGAVLHHTGLRHVPLLVPLLCGRLSLVGARPVPAALADRLSRAWPDGRGRFLHLRPGLFGLCRSEEAGLAACLAERLLFVRPYLLRLQRAGAAGTWRTDLAVVARCVARALARPHRGNDLVRLELPAVFRQCDLDPRRLAAAPAGVAGDVDERPDGSTTCWYPPRRSPLAAVPPERELLARLADEVGCEELVLRRPRSSRAGTDRLSLELPAGMAHAARAAEHLLPLWESLADAGGPPELPGRATLLLLAALARAEPASGQGRLVLRVEVDASLLRVSAAPLPGSGTEPAAPRAAPQARAPALAPEALLPRG